MIKNLENLIFWGLKIPKCEKKNGCGIPKSLTISSGKFHTTPKSKSPPIGVGNFHLCGEFIPKYCQRFENSHLIIFHILEFLPINNYIFQDFQSLLITFLYIFYKLWLYNWKKNSGLTAGLHIITHNIIHTVYLMILSYKQPTAGKKNGCIFSSTEISIFLEFPRPRVFDFLFGNYSPEKILNLFPVTLCILHY